MKKNIMLALAALTLSLVSTSSVLAEDTHVRLRTHADTVDSDGVGAVAWVSLPDVTVAPNNVFGAVGVALVDGPGRAELMVGGDFVNTSFVPSFDVRLSTSADVLFVDDVTLWANVRWVGFDDPDVSNVYSLLQLHAPLVQGLRVGVESENNLFINNKPAHVYSLGPMVALDLGILDLQASYQGVRDDGNQFWVRATYEL